MVWTGLQPLFGVPHRVRYPTPDCRAVRQNLWTQVKSADPVNFYFLKQCRDLQGLILEHCEKMHNQREKALQGSAARAAAEGLTSKHDVHAYTKALWAQLQQAACSAEA